VKYWLLNALAYCALAGVAQAAGVSGTYVGIAPNSAVLLQLVQTEGRNLVGRFEQYYVAPRGTQVQITNGSVIGAAGGHTVVLQIKLAEAFGDTIPASGDLKGDTLDLSGGRMGSTFDLHLVRSNVEAFQSQLRRLDTLASVQAQMQASAAATKKRLKQLREGRENVESATVALGKFDAGTPGMLHVVAAITARFPHITRVMRRLLAREGSIPFPSGQYQRGQVAYAIGQGVYQSGAAHFQLGQQELNAGYEQGRIAPPLADGTVGRASAFCMDPSQVKAPWCTQFDGALARYTVDRHELTAAFDKAEATYAREHTVQERLQFRANAVSNGG
jgi:hypothetical protein